MMSFYFIDDDKNITNILKLIVNTRGLGVCCGSAENAAEALADLPVMRPDIVLVDFLMPEMDGISFIKQAKKILPDAAYIMLSQVASKDMIASAYEAGVEFFIQKPINSVEVESIIRKVSGWFSRCIIFLPLTQTNPLFPSQQMSSRLRQICARSLHVSEL